MERIAFCSPLRMSAGGAIGFSVDGLIAPAARAHRGALDLERSADRGLRRRLVGGRDWRPRSVPRIRAFRVALGLYVLAAVVSSVYAADHEAGERDTGPADGRAGRALRPAHPAFASDRPAPAGDGLGTDLLRPAVDARDPWRRWDSARATSTEEGTRDGTSLPGAWRWTRSSGVIGPIRPPRQRGASYSAPLLRQRPHLCVGGSSPASDDRTA